jgi:hypothetical protein
MSAFAQADIQAAALILAGPSEQGSFENKPLLLIGEPLRARFVHA